MFSHFLSGAVQKYQQCPRLGMGEGEKKREKKKKYPKSKAYE